MRARLAVTVAGIRCELREVKLSAKPAAMLEASPKGTVPVLVLSDGTVIDESLDVMRWALAMHDPEGWLQREDAALIATNDGPFKRDLDGYKYPERHDADPIAHRTSGVAFLSQLEDRLAATPQLCGPSRGISDAAIMPFVRQFVAVDPDWFADERLPRVRSWLAGHLASDLFTTIMLRPKPWAPGDAPLLLPGEAVCALSDPQR
jgi:glutathione S-transferase